MHDKFEYCTKQLDVFTPDPAKLAELGTAGWELVQVIYAGCGAGYWHFKRRVAADPSKGAAARWGKQNPKPERPE